MEIVERDEGLLNFLSPAILVMIGILVLSIGALSLVLLHYFIPVLIPDQIMANVQINLVGQIIGITITFLILIPLFKLKQVETQKPTISRTVKVLGVACLALTVSTGLALVLFFLLTNLGIPVDSSYAGFILGPEHLSNPWNLVLLFAFAVFGAAIYEELIFRRMLIPALELRGMGPTAAVITSSLGFALIHVPNDLINGGFGFFITHFITTFTTGLFLGFVYVFTRNVIYPMIIHGFINGIAFTELILISLDDLNLLLIYASLLMALILIGIIVGVLALIWYFHDPSPKWVETMRVKSRITILPGFIGYLLIASGLITLQFLTELGLTLTLFPNLMAMYAGMVVFYIIYLAVSLFIISITRYESQVEVKPSTPQVYEKAEDVILEPHPE
ncbi:MAG: lysostaphin resistance A-like protein [Promethearchaeota archaeon]